MSFTTSSSPVTPVVSKFHNGNHHNMSFDFEILIMYDEFEKIGLQCLDGIRVLGFWVFPISIVLSYLISFALENQHYLWRLAIRFVLSPFSSSSSSASDAKIATNNNYYCGTENTIVSSEQESTSGCGPEILQSQQHILTKSKNMPKHIAVIMDGNRRFGKQQLGSALLGHKVGGEKLREFVRWCRAVDIEMLTVYAFSTENWNRPAQEVDLLMDLFSSFFEQMLIDAEEIGIRIRFISSEPEKLPPAILDLMRRVEKHTRQFGEGDKDENDDVPSTSHKEKKRRSICVNVCVSYGSRSALVKALQRSSINCFVDEDDGQNDSFSCDEEKEQRKFQYELAKSVLENEEEQEERNQQLLSSKKTKAMTKKKNITKEQDDSTTRKIVSKRITKRRDVELWSKPDILIRTSGEVRISNFMLYELAYTEMFFWDCTWPEVTKEMLINCLDEFSENRQRRMGK